jgi:hypothetical protein
MDGALKCAFAGSMFTNEGSMQREKVITERKMPLAADPWSEGKPLIEIEFIKGASGIELLRIRSHKGRGSVKP